MYAMEKDVPMAKGLLGQMYYGHFEAEGVYGTMLFGDWGDKHKAFKYLKNDFDQGFLREGIHL